MPGDEMILVIQSLRVQGNSYGEIERKTTMKKGTVFDALNANTRNSCHVGEVRANGRRYRLMYAKH